jgi:hypothetical protein
MKQLPFAALTLVLGLTTSGAFAECSRDAAPSLPDGSTATLEDMKSAQQAVKAYMASGNAYLVCLDEQGAQAGAEEAAEAKAARIANYNAAVDEQTAIAASFNAALQAYKARQ